MAANTLATDSNDGTVFLAYILLICQVCSVLTPSAAAFNVTYAQEDIYGDCWQYVRYRGGKVSSHPGYGYYADNADCKVTVTTDPKKRVYVRFEYFDLADSTNCYQDEVVVYDGKTFFSPLLSGTMHGLCGNELPVYLVSTGNILTVRFITDNIVSNNRGFSLIYTTIVPEEIQTDENSCFMCDDDSFCIDNSLKCDGLKNCEDGSDEDVELCYGNQNRDDYSSFSWLAWTGTIFGVIVAFVVVLIVAVIVVICCCCRNANQRARRHQHHYNNNMNGSMHQPGYAVQIQQNGRQGGYTASSVSRYGPSQITSGYASSEDGYFGNNSVTYHAGHQTVVALPPKA
ncbi:uncharacterized protein [Ptychodera flava]|uniref:uncharacterized protein n=1 Tax=Ptychodera flava TaxID=63121 RepID=UPI00396A1790